MLIVVAWTALIVFAITLCVATRRREDAEAGNRPAPDSGPDEARVISLPR
jgi:hypothetical protein